MHFLDFLVNQNKKIISYPSVNTDKLNFVAFLLSIGTTALFAAKESSSETFTRRDAIDSRPKTLFLVTGANKNTRKLVNIKKNKIERLH